MMSPLPAPVLLERKGARNRGNTWEYQ